MKNNNTSFHSSPSTFTRCKLAVAIASQLLLVGQALAVPTGGQVVGGSGSIERQGLEITILQDSDRLAIDWQSFDVGADERVAFVQPGQSAVTLNRILGTNGSEILGQIDANGHVILVNPNGIVFGQSATVNAGGLIASGLQINPDDFINGDLVFKGLEGTDGTIINSGVLNASLGGNVALLGKRVENRGLISANLGRVHLAAGQEAVLTFDQQGLLGVQIDAAVLQEELGDQAAVNNSGTIVAEQGQILLNAGTAKDVFSQAVNWGEQKQARSVVHNDDGSFTLGGGGEVSNSGTLDASGHHAAGTIVALGENVTNRGEIRADVITGHAGNVELHAQTTTQITDEGLVSASATESGVGGDIKLQGKNVGLFDRATVEASGANGGGSILIGGDREGLNKRVRNADFSYIAETAMVNANALEEGNGGNLIVFAEDTARIYGNLSVRGGELTGDGGFVETSGKKSFEIKGAPDLASRNGAGGHWLIDPYDITIRDGFLSTNISGENPFVSTGDDAVLFAVTLQTAMDQGGTVTVQTGSGNGDGQLGDITLEEAITLSADIESTLNLIAHNNINIASDANITADESRNRKLNINLHANAAGNQGSINIADGVTITTSGGDFTIGAINNESVDANSAGAYDVDFSGATINVTGRYAEPGERSDPSGRVAINAANDVALGDMQVNVSGTEGGDASIHLIAGGAITQAAALDVDALMRLSGDTINLPQDNTLTALSIDQAGSVTVSNDQDLDLHTVNVTDTLTLTVAGALTQSAPMDAGSLALFVSDQVDLAHDENEIGAFAGNIGGGTIDSRGPMALGDFDVHSNNFVLSLAGTGAALTQAAGSTLTSSRLVTINAPRVELGVEPDPSNTNIPPAIVLDSGADIRFGDVTYFSLNGAIAAGSGSDITVNGADAGGTYTFGAQASSNRAISLNAGNGADQLVAPDLENDWQVNTSEPHAFTAYQWVTRAPDGEPDGAPTEVREPRLTVNFTDIDTLEGGALKDVFVLNDGFDGTINGQAGNDEFIFNDNAGADMRLRGGAGDDSITGSNNENAWQLRASGTHALTSSDQTVTFSSIETIAGNADTDTLIGANAQTDWVIRGDGAVDKNAVTIVEDPEAEPVVQLAFSSMENLIGGNDNDTFVFSTQGIGIRVQGGRGNDTADYSPIAGNVLVQLGDGDDDGVSGIETFVGNGSDSRFEIASANDHNWTISSAHQGNVALVEEPEPMFSFEGFGQFVGKGDGAHTLMANTADALTWQIDEPNSGTVLTTRFEGFSSLQGGTGVDVFNFIGSGAISGTIDGAGGIDDVDLSQLEKSVSVSLGDDQDVFLRVTNIEDLTFTTNPSYQDNALYGANSANEWHVTDLNGGFLMGGGSSDNNLEFNNVDHLVGGTSDDLFVFTDDWAVSENPQARLRVNGGAHQGGDIANFSDVSRALELKVESLDEGISNIEMLVGNDRTSLVGPNQETTWDMDPDTDNKGELRFGDDDARLEFSGVSRLIGGDAADTFNLSGGNIGGGIAGGAGDDHLIKTLTSGVSSVTTIFDGGGGQNQITINGNESGFAGEYNAAELRPGTGNILSMAAQLIFTRSEADAVSAQTVQYSNVDVVEQLAAVDRLQINGTSAVETFELSATQFQNWFAVNGDTPVEYNNLTTNLVVAADAADVIAINDSFAVANRLTLQNASVVAQPEAVITSTNLTLDNVVKAGTEEIPLATNVLQLSVNGGSDAIHLLEKDDLRLHEVDTLGSLNIELTAGSLKVESPLRAGELRVNTGSGSASIDAKTTIEGNLLVAGSGIDVKADVDAQNIDLYAGKGNLSVGAAVLAGDRAALSGSNVDIAINGSVEAGGAMSIHSIDDVVLDGVLISTVSEISEDSNVLIEAGGDVFMGATSVIDSAHNSISITSGGDTALGEVSATEGDVFITAGGGVMDRNGEGADTAPNVMANTLRIRSGAGVGVANRLETQIANVDIVNTADSIRLANTGVVDILALWTSGNIDLHNDVDVVVGSGSVNAFYRHGEVLDPIANGTPDSTASFRLDSQHGSLVTRGGIDIHNPAISAYDVAIYTILGNFGGPGLPPVIYAPEQFTITALYSWNDPIWGFNIRPNKIVNNSEHQTNINAIGAGEQLVEVEALEDIDPAVFTAVKNYFHADISILMPQDQRYEDELE